MKLQDITNMDKDDVLGMLGLETRRSQSGRMLTTLGTFGIGLLVGAGVALLLAPKAGSELRQDLRAKLRRDGKGDVVAANGTDGATVGNATSSPA
jgi:gas vesicle protein